MSCCKVQYVIIFSFDRLNVYKWRLNLYVTWVDCNILSDRNVVNYN